MPIKLYTGLLLLALFIAACSGPPVDKLIYPKDGPVVARGRELVKGIAACGFCHGEKRTPNSMLVGGLPINDTYGELLAPNLTSSQDGLKKWSGEDIVKALRTSTGRNDMELSYEVHNGYEWVSDNDMIAIVSYLKTIPAVNNKVERREVGIVDRNTKGFLLSPKAVKGYVPEIDPANIKEYGRYLVDRVARCSSCHSAPLGVFGGGDYLAGGRVIKNESGEKEAPGLSIRRAYNSVEWNKDSWRDFFRKGIAPDGKPVDPDFCPIKFYAAAPDKDINPMIEYLASLE